MYLRDSTDLGNLSDVFKKVKKIADKIISATIPRELSPLRLIEKYSADSKKKAVVKLATLSIESDAHKASSDALLKMQIDTLNAAAPASTLTPAEVEASMPARVVPRLPAFNVTPWVIGGTLAFLALSIARRKRR